MKTRYYLLSFLRHDLKASFTVYFVALPLCLGISLASNAPVFSGIIAGIIGGLFISVVSGSQLSVSGPAAGLTAITAAALTQLGSFDLFFMAVAVAGLLQILLGVFRLGGFTHFIPSAVIKGMLAAIGVTLIAKQIPLLIGYARPDFWTNELFNIITLDHAFSHITDLYMFSSRGAIVITLACLMILILWQRKGNNVLPWLPTSIVVVISGSLLALLFQAYVPLLKLRPGQFVSIPAHVTINFHFPAPGTILQHAAIWKNAVLICFVACLETLLSVEAIDKLDAANRITPQSRELVAQGMGNFLSGILGGLPITAVIVRSSANNEAGARTWLSSFSHGLWLLLTLLLATPLVNHIPYCVLAVILVRTGYNLAKPGMIKAVYDQGREQFLPFIVTIIAMLFTDLLIGVLIGLLYALYFLVKHTYRAGFVMKEKRDGHLKHYTIELALNVSFLNKKRVLEMLDQVPPYSIVEIIGTDSVYIDHDVLEIFEEYKTKAQRKHINLILKNIPQVNLTALH